MADDDFDIESLSSGSSPIHVASSSRSKRADAFRNLDDEDDFDISEAQRILEGTNGNEASKDFDAMKIDDDLEDPLGREDDEEPQVFEPMLTFNWRSITQGVDGFRDSTATNTDKKFLSISDDENVEEETKSPTLLKLERMNEQLKVIRI